MSSTLWRYVVMQIPGVVVAAILVTLLWAGSIVSAWVALGGFLAWLVKDVVLYPLVKTAYEGEVACGADRLIGEVGTAATALDPTGRVRVRGELWKARLAEDGCFERGTKLVVIGSDGLTLLVRVPEAPSAAKRG